MLIMFTEEQEKYLTPVFGNGWNCVVKDTPKKILKFFRALNQAVREYSSEPEPIHFI